MEKLNTDIYDIATMVTELEQKYIDDEDPETLAAGIFGYFADVHSLILQNSIISTSELGNELFPARAKYERNLLSHGVINNIDYINAVPATIPCLVGIFEDDFDKYAVDNTFYLDKEIAIYIDQFEYHLDYDVKITKNYISNGNYVYTAQHYINLENKLSNITNPYINAPTIQKYNGKTVMYFYVTLRQVSHSIIPKKIITNNSIENKTIVFEFNNQLADFTIRATDGDRITYITPIMEGIGVDQSISTYCYYSFLDSTHVKVRFDSSSYIPKLNTNIEVLLKTTLGSEGNFEYNMSQYPIVSSKTYGYDDLPLCITFGGKSEGGLDRISTDELKRILPKESLSRGSITCQKDLDNYFSMYNTDSNRMITQKRVDNQFERSYYVYFLLKDNLDNVIPTNTFDIKVAESEFDTHDNRKYVLKPGCKILLKPDGIGRVISADSEEFALLDNVDDKTTFIYTVPFMLVVTGDPLYISYYLTIINDIKYLEFTYINMNSVLQFIAVYVEWTRGYIEDPNIYKMKLHLEENFEYDGQLVVYDENGNIVEQNLRVFAVIYNNDDSNPYRYIEGNLIDEYNFEFILETSDTINDDNKIRIDNVMVPVSGVKDYGYFDKELKVEIYVCAKLKEGEFGRYNLDSIVPGLEGFTVTNMYTVDDSVELYINYSQIIQSQVSDITIENRYSVEKGFHIKSVPCVRRSYVDNDLNMESFVNEIDYKKAYIDNALALLDNNMSIDFKFFNTYGPSQIYSTDLAGAEPIARTNLTICFATKLLGTADKNIKDFIIADVKAYVEDLNDISSLHIPNLIAQITNSYSKQLEYFEFIGFNDCGPGIQHLYRHNPETVNATPEFLTVHTNTNDLSPDIRIRLD